MNSIRLVDPTAENGHLHVLKALLGAGADFHVRTPRGFQEPSRTALDYAKENGHQEVVDYLVSRGATTARIFDASEDDNLAQVRNLLANFAEPNAYKGGLGRTPLCIASFPDTVKFCANS